MWSGMQQTGRVVFALAEIIAKLIHKTCSFFRLRLHLRASGKPEHKLSDCFQVVSAEHSLERK